MPPSYGGDHGVADKYEPVTNLFIPMPLRNAGIDPTETFNRYLISDWLSDLRPIYGRDIACRIEYAELSGLGD